MDSYTDGRVRKVFDIIPAYPKGTSFTIHDGHIRHPEPIIYEAIVCDDDVLRIRGKIDGAQVAMAKPIVFQIDMAGLLHRGHLRSDTLEKTAPDRDGIGLDMAD